MEIVAHIFVQYVFRRRRIFDSFPKRLSDAAGRWENASFVIRIRNSLFTHTIQLLMGFRCRRRHRSLICVILTNCRAILRSFVSRSDQTLTRCYLDCHLPLFYRRTVVLHFVARRLYRIFLPMAITINIPSFISMLHKRH